MSKTNAIRKFKQSLFLKDVFILACTAFGGPQVHFVQFIRRFCEKRRFISKEELIELYSFCQILPGPTSTQTITSLGLRMGGYKLASLTILIWILPATLLMTGVVLGYSWMQDHELLKIFKYIPAMAVGFLFAAAIKMLPLIKKKLGFYAIAFVSIVLVVLNHWYAINEFTSSILLPLILLMAAVVSQKFIDITFVPNQTPVGKISYKNLLIIGGVFLLLVLVGNAFRIREVLLFENTFRIGSLVFGGGQVLVPMMEAQYVHNTARLTATEFANGYGFLQAVPGPVFSFSTYVNGMAMKGEGPFNQVLGCIIGSIGIFLPGLLIMFFVYPIWDRVKQYPIVQRSLDGIVAAAVGLVFAAAILIFGSLWGNWQIQPSYSFDILVLLGTCLLVSFTKIPSPLVVILAILVGCI